MQINELLEKKKKYGNLTYSGTKTEQGRKIYRTEWSTKKKNKKYAYNYK